MARARKRLLSGVKRTSISGDRRSACSHERTFGVRQPVLSLTVPRGVDDDNLYSKISIPQIPLWPLDTNVQ